MFLNCAAEIQDTLKAENQNLPPGRRTAFCIDVNFGDVMGKGEQIDGEGVKRRRGWRISQQARAEAAEVMRISPRLTLASIAKSASLHPRWLIDERMAGLKSKFCGQHDETQAHGRSVRRCLGL
jgi:hypothetical protein